MIKVYTDGASRGNPGKSGAGIFIQADGEEYKYSFPLPEMSNHEAEFHAIIYALKICKRKFPNEIISFRSDSRILVDTIEKNFTKNKLFKPLLEEIRKHSGNFPYIFIKWIPSNENIHSDQLAKNAIHQHS